MKDDRDAILDRIRANTRRHMADLDRTPEANPLPPISSDLAAHFSEGAKLLASDIVGPLVETSAPRAVADYLRERKLPLHAVSWPTLKRLDWKAAGMAVEYRAAKGDDLVGITGAFCAIAETGTLMLLSGVDTPATVSLLPETHVALLPTSRIVARMEDAWALLHRDDRQGWREVEQRRDDCMDAGGRATSGRVAEQLPITLPRAVNFVSGPSRTADIELTVTLGAHGPYRVLIVLTN